MKNAEYGLTENLIFKEAVAFLKKKKTLTADEYKLLDEESKRSRYPGTRAWKYFRHFSMNFLMHVSREKQRKTSWIT